MTIEAKYYQKLKNKTVKCTLCPHECILNIGKFGICKTRQNIDGQLVSYAFANPVAINIDPVEKKPLHHFLPGTKTFSIATAGCNLRCKHCQNASISQVTPLDTDNYNLPPDKVVEMAIEHGCKSISYTYTDPVVFYEYTIETAKIAKQKGLKNIIVSAGYINPEPLKELIQYIDAANIDLKSFNELNYKKINGASLQPVLNTLKILKQQGVWLEITNLLIPTINDDEETIDNMCNWLISNGFEDTPLHFSKFYPTYKMLDILPTPIDTIRKAISIAQKNGIKYIISGNFYGDKYENTFCPNCGKIIIERKGYNIGKIKITNNKCNFCGEKIPGVWND
jgi:pyruvate formate lyase activating enzyme